MGWEEGARVMALSNIATAERSGKHLTLHAKDVHSLILVFADDRSTLSFPAPTLSPGGSESPTAADCSRIQSPHSGASAFHQQLLRIPKTEPLFAFPYYKASGVPYSLPTGTLHGVPLVLTPLAVSAETETVVVRSLPRVWANGYHRRGRWPMAHISRQRRL